MKFFFRRIFRVLRIAWLFLVTIVLGLGGLFMSRKKGMKRNLGIESWWGKRIISILGGKIVIHGTLPENKGVLLVSNHTCYLDAMVHASLIPLRFSPKKEVKSWPLLGFLVSLAFPIWVDRSSRKSSEITLQAFEQTLEDGFSLSVYPEGTFTTPGEILSKFKSTPFEAVIRKHGTILPILTRYTFSGDGPEKPATDGFPEMLRYYLEVASFQVDIWVLNEIHSTETDRKVLAEQVHDIMLKEAERVLRPAKNTEINK